MADTAPSERRRPGFLGFLGRWARGDAERHADPEAVPESARELVDHAQAFHSIRVEELMTPRADVIAVELSTPLGGVLAQFAESEHSRMPIYRETLDDPRSEERRVGKECRSRWS